MASLLAHSIRLSLVLRDAGVDCLHDIMSNWRFEDVRERMCVGAWRTISTNDCDRRSAHGCELGVFGRCGLVLNARYCSSNSRSQNVKWSVQSVRSVSTQLEADGLARIFNLWSEQRMSSASVAYHNFLDSTITAKVVADTPIDTDIQVLSISRSYASVRQSTSSSDRHIQRLLVHESTTAHPTISASNRNPPSLF